MFSAFTADLEPPRPSTEGLDFKFTAEPWNFELFTMPPRSKPQRSRHVELTDRIQKLLSDPDHRITNGTQNEIEKLLAGMPYDFRAQALDKYQDGFSAFGKVPIRTASFVSKDISITARPRPMACPEPPPVGSKFILAWKEGDLWNWDLSPLGEDSDQSALVRTAKYLNALRRLADSSDSQASQLGKSLLSKLPEKLQAISEDTDRHLLHAFEAGINFARLVLYRNVDSVFNSHQGRGAKSHWPDVIRHALVRHGQEIGWKELSKKLGLRPFSKEKAQAKENWILRSDWEYAPKPMTIREFKQKVSEAKKDLRGTL